MSESRTALNKLSLLHDIQQRSQQSASTLSQEDNLHGAWTAIGFRISNRNFLVPLDETREVFTVPSQITSVPNSEAWVYGIANLRGELLPLFDLKYFLFGQATHVNNRSRIIVNNHSDVFAGLLIDEVFGLKHFPNKPENMPSQSLDDTLSPYMTGMISQQDTSWNVISFNSLASDQRFLNVAA